MDSFKHHIFHAVLRLSSAEQDVHSTTTAWDIKRVSLDSSLVFEFDRWIYQKEQQAIKAMMDELDLRTKPICQIHTVNIISDPNEISLERAKELEHKFNAKANYSIEEDKPGFGKPMRYRDVKDQL